jgi:hypothetical protein
VLPMVRRRPGGARVLAPHHSLPVGGHGPRLRLARQRPARRRGARPHAQVPLRRGCEVRGDEGAVCCQGVDATASASAMAGCRREAAMVGEGRSSI